MQEHQTVAPEPQAGREGYYCTAASAVDPDFAIEGEGGGDGSGEPKTTDPPNDP